MRKHARELLESINQAISHARGEPTKGMRETTVHVPDVKAIRERLKMSQAEFAETYGIPVGTLRNWEQGLRKPDAPAAAYLRVIAKQPRIVREALN
ncbi:MAG: helix-turn-helix domain-containing protein [Alphaproteobacteria bacterium]|nr:helix-turn-helix domain-containing protein [Alphaproteobacteria bacterium]